MTTTATTSVTGSGAPETKPSKVLDGVKYLSKLLDGRLLWLHGGRQLRERGSLRLWLLRVLRTLQADLPLRPSYRYGYRGSNEATQVVLVLAGA